MDDGAQCYPTRETPVPNTEEKHMDPYDEDRDNYYQPMFHQASKQLQKAPDLGIPHNPGYNHSFQHKFRILMMKMLLCVFLGFAHVQMI